MFNEKRHGIIILNHQQKVPQNYYFTNVIVSGVNESPNIIDEGREPGLDDADLDCGRDAGLEPCCERGMFAFLLTGAGFHYSSFVLTCSVAMHH